MTNFDPAKLDWTTGSLAGWTYDKPVNKWFQGAFRHAHRLTRPCPTCTETIVLDVTTRALEGKATNHGLALRRCKKCRTALKAGPEAYAVRKAEVADKPAVVVTAPVQAVVALPADNEEMERLRTANATMKEELEGLYAQLKELRNRLAQYEEPDTPIVTEAPVAQPAAPRTYKLPEDRSLSAAVAATTKAAAAFTASKSAKPAKDAVTEELLQKWLTKNNAKMPWEDA